MADNVETSIVIAGFGRCGTWWLHNSINPEKNPTFNFHSFFSFGDVDFRRSKYIYKTHDLPPPMMRPNVRVIYMFGNPMNVIESGMENFTFRKPLVDTDNGYSAWEAFYKHHNADILEHKNIYKKDTLRLENDFDQWYRPQPFPFIALKYETLASIDLGPLYDFLGFRFDLLPFVERESCWTSSPHADDMRSAYGNLADKIERAAPLKVFDAIKVELPV